MFFSFARASLCTVGLLGLLTQPVQAGKERTELTLKTLTDGTAEELVQNRAFLPADSRAAAVEPFNGKLVLSPTEMQMQPELDSPEVMGQNAQMFPGVTLDFFTFEDDLVPVTQDVITPPDGKIKESYWQIIVQPGKVWSEPDDDGWSRASFPFALMNRLENDTHNGVATFLYKDGEVTDVRFQITQQTAPFYISTHFQGWGALPATYKPADRSSYSDPRQAYAVELEDRFETAKWDTLASGPEEASAVAEFEGDTNSEFVVMHALVRDEVLYYQPSSTPQGPYPYPTRMRFGVWSLTKSIGPALGMLRLAEKYGDWVFNLEVLDYLEVDPPHGGWHGVTFGDALNMTTGIGGGNVQANPNNFSVDYDFGGSYDKWFRARSESEKVAMLDKVGNYPWGPGEVARYRDRDMFALGVAMDNFLKSVEGQDENIWHMIANEVFEPIDIHHAPMNMTFENDGGVGQPIMAWGWYPTLGDLAKVAELLHARGEVDGKQVLHRGKTEELFSAQNAFDQGPSNSTKYGNLRYKMGYHYAPFRTSDGANVEWLPFMSGWIGNRVALAPNGMTGIRISKAWPAPDEAQAAVENPTSMFEAMHRLEPFEE